MSSRNQIFLGDGPKPEEAPRAGSGSQIAPTHHARVLIVEDELFVAWHLETLVRDLDLDVVGLVPDGEGAVEQAADFHPDLVLMDISLSGQIDGVEAARRICERQPVPVIFITAYTDNETKLRIQKAVPGAQVLAKPISPDTLRRAINNVLPIAG